MPKREIGVLIAAAGASSRMGFPKALMLIDGKVAAITLAEKFLLAKLAQVFITLPDAFFAGGTLVKQLEKLRIFAIKNRFATYGYAGSIMSGVKLLRPSSLGLFITPIDSSVKITLIRLMRDIAYCFSSRPLIIVPDCHHKAGHPTYLSHHFFNELLLCHRYLGLNRLIEHHKRHVLKLASFDDNTLININDQQTWLKVVIAKNKSQPL
ncbi:MAG TPA: NTP transferase domain-containing protein [Myxococcota bacterium]|nr:NTP transferase domain-containing protein [Myxococcota bacterium]